MLTLLANVTNECVPVIRLFFETFDFNWQRQQVFWQGCDLLKALRIMGDYAFFFFSPLIDAERRNWHGNQKADVGLNDTSLTQPARSRLCLKTNVVPNEDVPSEAVMGSIAAVTRWSRARRRGLKSTASPSECIRCLHYDTAERGFRCGADWQLLPRYLGAAST